MPSVIANEFGEASGLAGRLIGLGVALFVITIVVNLGARTLVERSIRKGRGE
jgi:ABC-type phosphate transport system permease subunit